MNQSIIPYAPYELYEPTSAPEIITGTPVKMKEGSMDRNGSMPRWRSGLSLEENMLKRMASLETGSYCIGISPDTQILRHRNSGYIVIECDVSIQTSDGFIHEFSYNNTDNNPGKREMLLVVDTEGPFENPVRFLLYFDNQLVATNEGCVTARGHAIAVPLMQSGPQNKEAAYLLCFAIGDHKTEKISSLIVDSSPKLIVLCQAVASGNVKRQVHP